MKEVTIYIDVYHKGNFKTGTGRYNTVLEYLTEDGVPITREVFKGINKTTKNRTALISAIDGLKALKEKCEATVIINSSYVVEAINQDWCYEWINLKENKKGNKPKNLDLWQQLIKQIKKHETTFEYLEKNEYTLAMECMARNIKIEYKEDLQNV